MSSPLLRIENLSTVPRGADVTGGEGRETTPGLDDVSLEVEEGTTTGIAGENGSGKTTLALAILRIKRPKRGQIYFNDRPILKMPEYRFRRLRGDIQMVYADSLASFRPGWNVRRLFMEVLNLHQKELSRKEKQKRMHYLLDSVGLSESCLKRQPTELNRFDRQRVGIARALAAQPRLLICDDPTRYLDTVSQARILDVLKDVQLHWRTTLIYLARDYAVVDHMSDRIHVMNRGRIVESGKPDELFQNARHEHTRHLLALSGGS